jgi:hypothetical protein
MRAGASFHDLRLNGGGELSPQSLPALPVAQTVPESPGRGHTGRLPLSLVDRKRHEADSLTAPAEASRLDCRKPCIARPAAAHLLGASAPHRITGAARAIDGWCRHRSQCGHELVRCRSPSVGARTRPRLVLRSELPVGQVSKAEIVRLAAHDGESDDGYGRAFQPQDLVP